MADLFMAISLFDLVKDIFNFDLFVDISDFFRDILSYIRPFEIISYLFRDKSDLSREYIFDLSRDLLPCQG